MDETPKIQKVSEVFRTTEEQVTNAYLAAGWMLLAVMTGHDEHDYPIYVLGWPNADKAKYPGNEHTRSNL